MSLRPPGQGPSPSAETPPPAILRPYQFAEKIQQDMAALFGADAPVGPNLEQGRRSRKSRALRRRHLLISSLIAGLIGLALGAALPEPRRHPFAKTCGRHLMLRSNPARLDPLNR